MTKLIRYTVECIATDKCDCKSPKTNISRIAVPFECRLFRVFSKELFSKELFSKEYSLCKHVSGVTEIVVKTWFCHWNFGPGKIGPGTKISVGINDSPGPFFLVKLVLP